MSPVPKSRAGMISLIRAAASKAIDRAGFAVIALALRQCLTDDPSGNAVDAASLEKLFLSLA